MFSKDYLDNFTFATNNNDEEYEEDNEKEEDENEDLEDELTSEELESLHLTVINFFMDNPSPSDDEVHNFAEELGLEPDDLEGYIYSILGSILGAGKSSEYDGEYDPDELEMGIKVEMEHTHDRLIAEKIAKDHLAEIKDYYTRLKKMEKDAGIRD